MIRRDFRAWFLPLAALALLPGILLGRVSDSLLPGLLTLAISGLAAFLLQDRLRTAAILLMISALGFLSGQIAYHPALPAEGDYLITGTVTQEFRLREDGQARTLLQEISLNGQRISGGGYWTFYLDEGEALPEGLIPGCRVAFRARVYHPGGPENPGGYDFREYLLQQGATIGVYGRDGLALSRETFRLTALPARLRYAVTQRLIAVMGEEAGRYASTMLLGARHLIPDEDREAFSRLGIAHVLSVSGYHTGVLAFALAWLFGRLKLSLKLRTICTAALLALYCLITGANPPVIRAAILSILALCGRLAHRQNLRLHLLSLSALVILLISPVQLTSASFQLSYGAMLGIVLVSPVLEKRLCGSRRRVSTWVQLLCLCAGAQLGVLAPQLYWFHELPLFSLPINMLITGGVTALMGLFWFMLALLPFGAFAQFVGSGAARLIHMVLEAIRFCGQADFLALWTKQANLLTLAGWCLLLWSLSPLCIRARRTPCLMGIAALCLSLIPLPHLSTTYTQLSVGDADAALLHDRDTVIAIDTGEDSALAEHLHQRRLSLDGLILTHLHLDHVGGLEALLAQRIPVKALYLPEGALDAQITPESRELVQRLLDSGAELITLARGDEIHLPSGSLTVLWPEDGRVRPNQDANLYSTVLRAELSGTTMLLTGDIDGAYEHYVAAPADILKIAHHGSTSATKPDFLSVAAPQTLLLSCSDEARAEEVSARMEGPPLYATCSGGAITIEFTDQEYTVRTLR